MPRDHWTTSGQPIRYKIDITSHSMIIGQIKGRKRTDEVSYTLVLSEVTFWPNSVNYYIDPT